MAEIIISQEQSGKRLDKFLMREIFCNDKISRGEIIREIKKGDVLINGEKIKPSYVLKENDVLEIKFEVNEKRENNPIPNLKLKIKIIEENKNFLVIDKPAGIQVHPDVNEKNNTIVNWLIAKYPETKNIHDQSMGAELRPGIVHRLDRDTSGVMLVAKNQKTLEDLKKLFQTRKIKKTYLAIVHGKFDEKRGVVEKPIAKSSSYKKQTIASRRTRTKIRPALTEYAVIKESEDYSLVEAFPGTGRTHQIRIHLWSLGHPVVGDRLYKLKNYRTGTERQLLHAKSLEFSLGGKAYSFSTPTPQDFNLFLRSSSLK
jgi:23S rRNA pseudouridine1911/1915/1917 synthase